MRLLCFESILNLSALYICVGIRENGTEENIAELIVSHGYAERLTPTEFRLSASRPTDADVGRLYVPTRKSDFTSRPLQYAQVVAGYPISNNLLNANTDVNLGGNPFFSRLGRRINNKNHHKSSSEVDDDSSLNSSTDNLSSLDDSISSSFEQINRLDSDSRSFSGGKIELRGPHSALEVNYHSVANIGYSKRARVERDSINYACIDDDPTNPSTRLLIATSVSLNPERTSMTLRKTSLLPKLPGLASLCCLLFTPMAEMRVEDIEEKYFSGALCGLGFDAQNRQPIFADNDIECVFDVKVDILDLKMV